MLENDDGDDIPLISSPGVRAVRETCYRARYTSGIIILLILFVSYFIGTGDWKNNYIKHTRKPVVHRDGGAGKMCPEGCIT